MAHVCPHCNKPLDIRLIAAPPSSAAPAFEVGDVGELLGAVVDSKLNDWEAKFIADLREKYAKYKDRIRMSEKQMATLRKIVAGDAEDNW